MKELEKKESDYTYRFLTDDITNGIISCGFLSRSAKTDSLVNFTSEYYTCFVLLEGKGTLTDEQGNSYPIVPNTLCQRLPGHQYSLIIDPDEEWYEFYISIGKSTFDSLSSLNLLHLVSPVFQIHMKPYLRQWFSEALYHLKNTSNSELPEVLFITQKLLINLHREDIRSYETNTDAIIAGAKQMISYKYNEDISFEEIAASFNISYEKFRKFFRKEVGVSPIQYRLKVKFQFAQRLLYEGLSIKMVAAEVGYSDPFVFSRQFKKYMGVSPSSFKNK